VIRCSICRTLVQSADEKVACDQCRQTYHASCWKDLGGCATYGCTKAPDVEKPAPPVAAGAGWGDEKQCPACRRTIASGALFCPCGARFPYADPMSPAEWREHERRRLEGRRRRTSILVLFLLSLSGILAPLTGAFAGWIAWNHRAELEGAGGTYAAMGFGAATLGATYAVVLFLLAIGS
jgi:hypothetical protein